jgi:alkanesulfonate monooxygenase SsuD/methylene tetrahydromethanopterin reductase-like flavin-dependent oxidoreductase (luciferase family)
VRGPLTVPRSPQGRPVLLQAGSSGRGRDFAARWAELIFTGNPDIDVARSHYKDQKERIAERGRDPAQVKMLPMAYTVVGESRAHAEEREQLFLNELVDPEASLALLSELMNHDFSGLGLDAPITDELIASVSGIRGLVQNLRQLALSSASPSIVVRLYRAIDRPDLAEDPDYVDPVRRQERALEVDDLVAKWVGERTLDEAMGVFEAAQVTAAPVYDAQQLLEDEHLRARGTFVSHDDPDLGPVTVQGPVAALTETPGRIEDLGRPLGADNEAVLGGLLELDPDRLAALRAAGII